MITKPKIAGFGMNFQHCHKMVFVGLGDSFESYYQCIRRCWRFGQSRPVDVYIVLSEVEQGIYENVLRKEAEAKVMGDKLIENVKEFEREEIQEVTQDFQYETDTVRGKDYVLMLGDSVERMAEIEPDSVGLSVFSPPFMSLYTYSPTERDIGNSQTEEDFFRHFGYIIDELLRVTMPGRNCCVHVAQVPAMLGRDGYIGLKDFRGKTIQAFEDRGWIYHGEVCIDKDPQAQAIRTHSKGLLFVQLKKDASWLRPALADYILVFRKPGENPAPVKPDLTNDEWIEFARPIWYGIRESDTLNVAEGRDENDERHICPLQLGTIERCVRLWSNPGDLVCSPFAGIGSEGYMALKLRRKFVGIELKRSYYEAAKKNLKMAINEKAQLSLLDFLQAKPEEGVSMP
jgi:DNA modification methylase